MTLRLAEIRHPSMMRQRRLNRRYRLLELLGPALMLAALFSGGGAMVQSHFDAIAADKADRIRATDQSRERAAAAEKIAALEGTINDERKRNAAESERRYKLDLRLGARNKRVRLELESALSDSRTDAKRCTAGAARIAAIAARALDALDQAAEGIGGLEKRNATLEAKLAEWERYDAGPEQVTVTGARK
jgi:hypothetical protein